MILIPGLSGSPSLALDAPDLSLRQQKVLACIAGWPLTHGVCPKVREIVAALGWNSPNAVQQPIQSLRALGYLEPGGGVASLRVAKPLRWREGAT